MGYEDTTIRVLVEYLKTTDPPVVLVKAGSVAITQGTTLPGATIPQATVAEGQRSAAPVINLQDTP
jgi:hypothetical protein